MKDWNAVKKDDEVVVVGDLYYILTDKLSNKGSPSTWCACFGGLRKLAGEKRHFGLVLRVILSVYVCRISMA